MTCRLLQNLLYWQIHPHWYVTRYLYDTIVWYRNDLVKLQKEHAQQWYVSTSPKTTDLLLRSCVVCLDDSGWTGAASRLTIFEGVDLLTPGAFDAAITGCEAVLHTASPFYVKGGSEEGKGEKPEGRWRCELGWEGRCKLIFFSAFGFWMFLGVSSFCVQARKSWLRLLWKALWKWTLLTTPYRIYCKVHQSMRKGNVGKSQKC